MPLQTKLRFGFQIVLLALFAYTGWQAWDFATLARYLPLTISIVAFTMMLIGLLQDVYAYRSTGVAAAGVPETAALYGAEETERELLEEAEARHTSVSELIEEDPEVESPYAVMGRALRMIGWIFAYVAAIWVIGLMAASAAFLLAFLWFEARAGWKLPVVGTIAILVGLTTMRIALNLEWPDYLIEDLLP